MKLTSFGDREIQTLSVRWSHLLNSFSLVLNEIPKSVSPAPPAYDGLRFGESQTVTAGKVLGTLLYEWACPSLELRVTQQKNSSMPNI